MFYEFPMGRKKILYVDDENDWRRMVSTFFKVAGYQVVTAKDGSEALAETEGVGLGAIILDVNLAGEDGIMLMKYLNHNHPDVPIILYTGLPHDDESIQVLLAAGAHQYLRKGSMGELLKCVQELYRG